MRRRRFFRRRRGGLGRRIGRYLKRRGYRRRKRARKYGKAFRKPPLQHFDRDFDYTLLFRYPNPGTSSAWYPIFATGTSGAIVQGVDEGQRVGNKIICRGFDLRGKFQVPAGASQNDDTIFTIWIVKALCTADQLLQNPADITTNYPTVSDAINDALFDTNDKASNFWAGLWHRQEDPNKRKHKKKIKTVFFKRFIIHQERPSLDDIAKMYFKVFKKQKHGLRYQQGVDDYPHVGQYYISIFADVDTQTVGVINQVELKTRWWWQKAKQ